MARHPEIPTAHRVTTSLSESDTYWLNATADRYGVSRAEVVRWALARWRKAERRNREPHDD